MKLCFAHLAAIALLSVVWSGAASAQSCTGRFVNPISDVCWEEDDALLPGGAQATVPVVQPVAFAQQGDGRPVGRDDPTAPVDLDDAEPGVLDQRGERRSERPGIDQRLSGT